MGQLLFGKKAIITGSSRGIGRSIAMEFAKNGAEFLINYYESREAAEELASEIRDLGLIALTMKASVAESAAVHNMICRAAEEFGQVDIMVNNAGLTRDALLMIMTENAWDEVIATNLKGLFYCCKEVVRLMIKQKRGSIINIASLTGVAGQAGQCNYAASKGGVIAFTKSLAQEVGAFGIRVNTIAPGLIRTSITDASFKNGFDVKRIPMRRLGMPEEVANAAVFLASDMASYVTGTVLHVNGGLYM